MPFPVSGAAASGGGPVFTDEQKVVEHLKMIQGVIERMGRNSFQLKAWSAALATGWLAFVARGGSEAMNPGFLVLVPFLLLFWLDGYYLWQERLFRHLYDAVRQSDSSDFSMDTSRWLQTTKQGAALFSRTVLIYHFAIVVLAIAPEVLSAQGVL